MPEEDIQLRREIYRADVEKMIEWMDDRRVTAHLNEEQNIGGTLRRMLRRCSLPIFSPQFNRNGSFFLIVHPEDGPIGFLRLVPKGENAEIVVVIGEPSQWGHGFGTRAIRKGVRHAFSEWRKRRVVAKIRRRNERSKAVFRKVGFRKVREKETEETFVLPAPSPA